jgi:hypothetical protein
VKVLRGPLQGLECRPHQFGVDWISVSDMDGNPLRFRGVPVLLRPDQVELTTDDDRAIFAPVRGRDGVFWQRWELTEGGRFVRKGDERPPLPRRRPAPYVPGSRR